MQFRSTILALASAFSLGTAFADTSVVFDASTASSSAVSFVDAASAAGLATDSGVKLTGLVDSSVYTLSLSFSLDNTGYWRKLVDFSNLASDTGLYVNEGLLSFYFANPVGVGYDYALWGRDTVSAGSLVNVSLSRNAAGLVSVSLNGNEQIVFSDERGDAVFTSVNGQTVAHVFSDDVITNRAQTNFLDEQAVGTIKSINVTSTSPVPEPGALALAAAGLMTVVSLSRRRQQRG